MKFQRIPGKGQTPLGALTPHPLPLPAPFALANTREKPDGDDSPLFLTNADEIDADGWALIAPFGEHEKVRYVRTPDGGIAEERFIQVLDNESADGLVRKENSFFRRLRRAIVGIPVYKEHPDLAKYSKETLTNGTAPAATVGVVDDIRVAERGVEAHFTLTPEGASIVENDGCKKPSPLWMVKPVGLDGTGKIRVRPFKLLSVGLTTHPNISGVDSLANANATKPADAQKIKEPDMKLIAGWLLAQGVALANTEAPTEPQVLEAFQRLVTSKAGEVTTLGNEKQTLTGKITGLEGERTTLTGKVTALENEKTTLTNRVTALENDFKAERKARAETLVDLTITQGKLAVAERDGKITALCNAQDFAAEAKKLGELPVKFKIGGAAVADAGRKEGADATRSAQEQVLTLANTDERYKNLPWEEAWKRIMTDHPLLKEQLAPATK